MTMEEARTDGRQPGEIRPVSIETNVSKWAEGSTKISVGDTIVICNATVNPDVPAWMKNRGTGWVTAEYSMLPRANRIRTPREITRMRPDGRTQEIQRLIGRVLRSVIDLAALGERTIIVDCDVIQADGGTRTASITGGFVALTLAARSLVEKGLIKTEPVREPVAAVSVGLVKDTVMLDLDYGEDSSAQVDMNVVMTKSGRLVEIQGTAEGATFTEDDLADFLVAARRGIGLLVAAQETALGGSGEDA